MNSRHPIHRILFVALLGACLVPGASWGQDINRVRQIRFERADGKTVVHVPGTRGVNFTAFAADSPPRIVLELASTWFEDTATPLDVDDWTVSSVSLSNHGKTGQTKGRVTVFLARKAGYQVLTKDQTVQLVLTPEQAPPPSTEEATARLARLQKQATEMENRLREAQAAAEKLRVERARLENESARRKTDLTDSRKTGDQLARDRKSVV